MNPVVQLAFACVCFSAMKLSQSSRLMRSKSLPNLTSHPTDALIRPSSCPEELLRQRKFSSPYFRGSIKQFIAFTTVVETSYDDQIPFEEPALPQIPPSSRRLRNFPIHETQKRRSSKNLDNQIICTNFIDNCFQDALDKVG